MWAKSIAAPWGVFNESTRLLLLPLVRFYFILWGVPWRRGWSIFGLPIIQRYRGSQIMLGNNLSLRSTWGSNPLAPAHPVVLATRTAEAQIAIGDDVGITGGTICASLSVTIGDRVLVGSDVTIVDTDFHPLDMAARRNFDQVGECAPVVIESDVFIGMKAIILKGVRIGRGSVIGAGSVVTRDVPPHSICAGNPASVVRYL